MPRVRLVTPDGGRGARKVHFAWKLLLSLAYVTTPSTRQFHHVAPVTITELIAWFSCRTFDRTARNKLLFFCRCLRKQLALGKAFTSYHILNTLFARRKYNQPSSCSSHYYSIPDSNTDTSLYSSRLYRGLPHPRPQLI